MSTIKVTAQVNRTNNSGRKEDVIIAEGVLSYNDAAKLFRELRQHGANFMNRETDFAPNDTPSVEMWVGDFLSERLTLTGARRQLAKSFRYFFTSASDDTSDFTRFLEATRAGDI